MVGILSADASGSFSLVGDGIFVDGIALVALSIAVGRALSASSDD